MGLFFAVVVTMTAFAANSVLNRIGVAGFGMDPFVFALIRVAAGAVTLSIVVGASGRNPLTRLGERGGGALALSTYMIGFSYAYLTLGAGLGALILFGALQAFMFGWAACRGAHIPAMRWLGVCVALIGLVVLMWPAGVSVVPLAGTAAMILAALGWAAYTILGQAEADPLAASAGNFILCLPLVALPLLGGAAGEFAVGGLIAAVTAGAITSGLGYALWYRVLPALPVTVAAISQLSVPVIAVAAGVILLGEPVTARVIIAGSLVLGGIALSTLRWVPARRS
tara:strand:- start:30132 stop:30980 length:849 start_codon:yes stop_codon:yes gene_type:complete